jgi:hypothetical protein
MYPEDRVLVGVISSKRDLNLMLKERWYRIPHARAPRSIDAEYLAFYLSSGVYEKNGAIHYFARRTGYELTRRRDLLPKQPTHPRANDLYYKLELGEVHEKVPPITNPTARAISFIYTTWDRFVSAATIADLYSKSDWFVERVVHVLREIGITPERLWQNEDQTQQIAELRIQCEKGIVRATTGESAEGFLSMLSGESDDEVNATVIAIREAVAALGGPKMVNIAVE